MTATTEIEAFRRRGREDGLERGRLMVCYALDHAGYGDLRSIYESDVAAWFEAKETEIRAAGANVHEIVEYMKAANAAMTALHRDAGRYVAKELANIAGSRHERRAARAKDRKVRA